MKPRPTLPRRPETLRALALLAGLGFSLELSAAPTNPWASWAPVKVEAPALYDLALSPEVLNGARADLADLRLLDPDGMEVPFVVRRPKPVRAGRSPVRSFRAELKGKTTKLRLETGATRPIGGVILETPASSFIKAATLEASKDGKNFVVLGRGVPLFRESGSENLRLDFGPSLWPWLEITIDDEREGPVAWTGAVVDESSGPDHFSEPVLVQIRARDETPNTTRFVLDLGAANLSLATVELVTSDPLFQRRVSLREAALDEEGIRERELHAGFIYAVEAAKDGASRRTIISVDHTFGQRELIVVVHNGDSPPMEISEIRVRRRPVVLRFQTREAGAHRIFFGNRKASAPNYDLAGLGVELQEATAGAAELGSVQPNPEHQPPEALPELAELGAEIDVSAWRYRKPITLGGRGVHALELGPDVLSHAAADLSDLRLVFQGRQVPYVIEHPSISRRIEPEVVLERDEKRPSLTRWRFKLSHPRLPLTALECRPITPLFRRDLSLFEQVSDGRGGKYKRTLGSSTWEQRSETKDRTAILFLVEAPRSDELVLETDNGDNPALELADCRFSHRVRRVVFKTSQSPVLHYGNPKASRPRYDLSLVADELLAAERSKAESGPEEDVGAKAPFEGEEMMGLESWIFWAVLAAVMLGLLLVIAKLLPKPASRE